MSIYYGPLDPETGKKRRLSKSLETGKPGETLYEFQVRLAKACFEAFFEGNKRMKWNNLKPEEQRLWMNVADVAESLVFQMLNVN